jgi:hypothetical protein
MGLRSDQEWMIEFWMFFDLCKRHRRPDVEQVYLAVQSGLAYKVKRVNVGPLLSEIRPVGYRGLDDGFDPGIGMSGLAFFNWIYKIELEDEGHTDYHTYTFTRKHDNKKILLTLKTTNDPRSEFADRDYRQQLKKLEKSRNTLMVTKRYGTLTEFWFGD